VMEWREGKMMLRDMQDSTVMSEGAVDLCTKKEDTAQFISSYSLN
jgi:hypothetical protein